MEYSLHVRRQMGKHHCHPAVRKCLIFQPIMLEFDHLGGGGPKRGPSKTMAASAARWSMRPYYDRRDSFSIPWIGRILIMQNAGILPSRYGLDQHGIRNIAIAYWNLGTAQLVEHAIRRHEGLLAAGDRS